ncbi:MAG: biotin--[acetyl-CoA-carboxylase] ligase [Peptococcaceae bacterium]
MKAKILEILNNSQDYISGERLSELCGVSRTAIWKQINNLKKEGYKIDTQPRTGYLLKSRPDKFIKAEILAELATLNWGENIYTFAEVDSTNNVAKKLAAEGRPEGTIVVAERQLQGKGRLGRTWVSPTGKGIWVSLILRPDILPTASPQITFVLAVAMVKALKKSLNITPKIKWPNDILIDGKKVAGILTELSAEIERVNYIIVGIGVNANQNPADFPAEFREKATSLKSVLGREIPRVKVLQGMLEEIESTYQEYLRGDFSTVIKEWKANSLTIGQEVEVIMGAEKIAGNAVDVDHDGCLIVRDAGGELHRIIAGDVSLRNKDGRYV